MRDTFVDFTEFSNAQLHVLCGLLRGRPLLYTSAWGGRKTTLLALAAEEFHGTLNVPSVLIAPERLRENELAAIEKLGVRCGVAGSSIRQLQTDPRFRRYDLIFIPMELLNQPAEQQLFEAVFGYGLGILACHEPDVMSDAFTWILEKGVKDGYPEYITSRSVPSGTDKGYLKITECARRKPTSVRKLNFISREDKDRWLLSHLGTMPGHGIVYCADEETCLKLSRRLIGEMGIAAEPYAGFTEEDHMHRLHYLTRRFAEGSLPVIVAPHNAAVFLSSSGLSFIIHYDKPNLKKLYDSHVAQISIFASQPQVIDLNSGK